MYQKKKKKKVKKIPFLKEKRGKKNKKGNFILNLKHGDIYLICYQKL